ncbi:MAG: ion transporter [Pirellulaceae bacterium]|jgi:voltage-gated sodium channel|nr:ion transporter [Pirellulaceae bacterium]
MTDVLKKLVDSNGFQYFVLAMIAAAAILVGIETFPSATANYGDMINFLNRLILWVFVLEAALKMAQHGGRFLRYFYDPWNVFDFVIIAVCFLPINAQYAAVLRLARVFRSLRLVTSLPKLQLLVNSLLRSIPSMIYVGIMLLLLFYVYGVMGVFLFRANDPVHFVNLPTSMLTLFRVVTQEDWTDVMYIQMYGSDIYPYVNTTDIEPVPSARPVFSALFFVSFVFLGTMIMLNLFIGVILNSMDDVQEQRERDLRSKDLASRGQLDLEQGIAAIDQQLDAIKQQLQSLRS